MSLEQDSILDPLSKIKLGSNFVKIEDFGCTFKVYRAKKSERVIAVSLWKHSLGYVYNLSTSLLKWTKLAKILFPEWNIRFYIDRSVLLPLNKLKNTVEKDIRDMIIKREKENIFLNALADRTVLSEAQLQEELLYIKDEIDKKVKATVDSADTTQWDTILEQLLKHNNVELWFYNCPWGANNDLCLGCHKNTFGSLVRFHATIDQDVTICIIRNLELLTSELDSDNVDKWLGTNTAFHTYHLLDAGYTCNKLFSYFDLCSSNLPINSNILLASCGFRKDTKEKLLFTYDMIKAEIDNEKTALNTFKYGVDEVILTKIVKPQLHTDNFHMTLIYDIQYIFDRILKWNTDAIDELSVKLNKIVLDWAKSRSIYTKVQVATTVKDLFRYGSKPTDAFENPVYVKELIKSLTDAILPDSKLLKSLEVTLKTLFLENKDIAIEMYTMIKSGQATSTILYYFLSNYCPIDEVFPGMPFKDKNFSLGAKKRKLDLSHETLFELEAKSKQAGGAVNYRYQYLKYKKKYMDEKLIY